MVAKKKAVRKKARKPAAKKAAKKPLAPAQAVPKAPSWPPVGKQHGKKVMAPAAVMGQTVDLVLVKTGNGGMRMGVGLQGHRIATVKMPYADASAAISRVRAAGQNPDNLSKVPSVFSAVAKGDPQAGFRMKAIMDSRKKRNHPAGYSPKPIGAKP